MEVKRICAAYWSATGNTDKTVNTIAETLAEKLGVPLERRNFTRPSDRAEDLSFTGGDLVVFGMPTYAGKLPNKMLPYVQQQIHGNGALAVGVVTFGNRSYDNSLAELCAALEQYDAEQRRNVPTAQEMFNKPEQELSEVERMMLSILAEEAAAPVPEAEPEEKTEPEAEVEAEAEAEAKIEAAAEPEAEAEPEADAGTPAAEPESELKFELKEAPAAKPEEKPEEAPDAKPEAEPEEKPEETPDAKPEASKPEPQPLPNKFRPEKPAAKPEVKPERKPEKPPVKKPEPYRPAPAKPKKKAPDAQRQSHKAGVLLTVLIICAAVLAVLLLRSLGVFGTPSAAETTPTPAPTAPVETAVPTETPTPTPTPKPEPTYEVVKADVSWADAEAAAEAKGGHLVVIDSAEKWTRVAQLADESGLTYVWIGLYRADSGELAWVKDNIDSVYNWAAGEPSVRDTNGAAENYVLIARRSDGWYYNDCIGDPAAKYPQFYGGKTGYIIEIDP